MALTPQQLQQLAQRYASGQLPREEVAALPIEDVQALAAATKDMPKPKSVGFNAPPPSKGEPSIQGLNLASPGKWESILAMPASLAGLYPPAKPFTTAAAGVLGGVGAGIDELSNPEGFNIGNILSGGIRQAGIEAGGKFIGETIPRGMMKQTISGIDNAGADAALAARANPLRGGIKFNPRPVGTDTAMAERLAGQLGENVGERIKSFDPAANMTPRVELFKDFSKTADKLEGQSIREADTRRALRKEVQNSYGQGPREFTPEELQQKKIGARKGFERLQRAGIKNENIPGPSVIDELAGNNAQRRLEEIDTTHRGTMSPFKQLFTPSIKSMNKELGGALDLREALQLGGGEGGFGTRVAVGSVVGALPKMGYNMIVNGGSDNQNLLERYGPSSMAAALAYGLLPAESAKILQLGGKLAPFALRDLTGDQWGEKALNKLTHLKDPASKKKKPSDGEPQQ